MFSWMLLVFYAYSFYVIVCDTNFLLTEGQQESIVQDIENMVRSYVDKPNSIILAISPANQDIATSDAIKLARDVDPSGTFYIFFTVAFQIFLTYDNNFMHILFYCHTAVLQ
jgi:hypothetical protein